MMENVVIARQTLWHKLFLCLILNNAVSYGKPEPTNHRKSLLGTCDITTSAGGLTGIAATTAPGITGRLGLAIVRTRNVDVGCGMTITIYGFSYSRATRDPMSWIEINATAIAIGSGIIRLGLGKKGSRWRRIRGAVGLGMMLGFGEAEVSYDWHSRATYFQFQISTWLPFPLP